MALHKGQTLTTETITQLSPQESKQFRKFLNSIKKGLPVLERAATAISTDLKSLRNHTKIRRELKEKYELKIRESVLHALYRQLDTVTLTDDNGNEETRETLNTKTTDQLVELLFQSIDELNRFVQGRY